MKVEIGPFKVKVVAGMTGKTMEITDDAEVTWQEYSRSEFYVVSFDVATSHDVMDEDDAPLSFEIAARIPINHADEPISAIRVRAEEQLAQDLELLAAELRKGR